MRLLVLVFLGYFISSVVACFSEYGVYERTLYWYAYKLDVAVHGKPRQIAERCTRNKAKSECNFQEFLNFIDKSPSPKRIAGDISGNSVDELAQTLRDHGYTGKYKPHHVISSILDEPEQMGALFNRFSDAMEGLQDKAKNSNDPSVSTLLENAKTSLKAVMYLREYEYSNGLIEWLNDNWGYVSVVMEMHGPTNGAGKRVFIDLIQTGKRNGVDITNIHEKYKEVVGINSGIIATLQESLNRLGDETMAMIGDDGSWRLHDTYLVNQAKIKNT